MRADAGLDQHIFAHHAGGGGHSARDGAGDRFFACTLRLIAELVVLPT